MKQFILTWSVLLLVICLPASGQHRDSSLQGMIAGAKQMFSWEIKEVKSRGYMMFLDVPYAVAESPRNYISLTVAKKYREERPAFISFTLPDHVVKEKGIKLSFSKEFGENDKEKWYSIGFERHWNNNRTFTSRLWNGFLLENKDSGRIDIFEKMMTYKQLFMAVYDSSGVHQIVIPLFIFQKQYTHLPSVDKKPIYSTGNPEDTALTVSDMKDRKIFDDGSIPTSWEMAGIDDPIGLKHFIRYFRYLMNHDKKEQMARLIVFPQDHVIPECKDSVDFINHYDEIFDQDLKRIINDQKLDQLFRNYSGVLIGSAPCIWIRKMGNRYKITAIANDEMDKKIGRANKIHDKAKNNKR